MSYFSKPQLNLLCAIESKFEYKENELLRNL